MHKFDPKHMDRLLHPARIRSQDPETVLDALGVQAGMVVADVGSGPGFFTLPMAVRVGPGGKVFAVDMEPQMLVRLQERAAEAGLSNITTLRSEDGSPPLSQGSIDAALMVNVLHELGERVAFLRQLLDALRPGGALAIVEWNKERGEVGPPAELRIDSGEVTSFLQVAGYDNIVPFQVGAYHYGLRAIKPAR